MAEPLCEFCEHRAGETRSLTVTSSIAICSECIMLPLDLIETRTFGSRVIYERYRRVRDGSD